MKKKYIYGFILIFIFWSFLHYIMNSPTIPSFFDVIKSLFLAIKEEKFLINLLSTLKIVFIGIIVSSFFGITFGVFIHRFKICRNTLEPFIMILKNIPPITLFPILLIIFGIKDISRIMIIIWVSLPPIMISMIDGLKNVDKEIVEASSLETTENNILFFVKMPLSLKSLFIGIKSGIGAGFCAIVTAEMLGANKGIGYMILYSTNTYKYSFTYAYIIIVVLIGLFFDLVFNIIIKILNWRYY